MTKTIYHYHPDTKEYVGEGIADISPLEPDVFLIPAFATEAKPIFKKDKITKFVNEKWILESLPLPIEPKKPTLEEIKNFKMYEIKNACEIFRTKPLIVDDKTYKATDNAKLKFWSLVNGSTTSNYPIIWLEADDISFVSLTKVQAIALYDAFETQDRSAYKQRGAYLNQVKACTTIEEIEAIIINFQ